MSPSFCRTKRLDGAHRLINPRFRELSVCERDSLTREVINISQPPAADFAYLPPPRRRTELKTMIAIKAPAFQKRTDISIINGELIVTSRGVQMFTEMLGYITGSDVSEAVRRRELCAQGYEITATEVMVIKSLLETDCSYTAAMRIVDQLSFHESSLVTKNLVHPEDRGTDSFYKFESIKSKVLANQRRVPTKLTASEIIERAAQIVDALSPSYGIMSAETVRMRSILTHEELVDEIFSSKLGDQSFIFSRAIKCVCTVPGKSLSDHVHCMQVEIKYWCDNAPLFNLAGTLFSGTMPIENFEDDDEWETVSGVSIDFDDMSDSTSMIDDYFDF